MQQIADYGHDTAENILWQPQDNALYWLDIPAGKLFRGAFHNKEQEDLSSFESACILQLDQPVGGFVFYQVADKVGFLLFASEGHIYQWCYEHGNTAQPKQQLYCQVEPSLVPTRFNDVFAWPSLQGRFVLCGTMPSDGQVDSRLLLLDTADKSYQVVLQDLKLANGMGLCNDYFYFADTRDFVVHRFPVIDFERAEIQWDLGERFIDFDGRLGRPDGLCLGKDACIWLAETGASSVTCFDTYRGQELGKLKIATPKVTSCCLGGRNQDILFVSTQGGQGEMGVAGGIFAQKQPVPFASFCGKKETIIQLHQ